MTIILPRGARSRPAARLALLFLGLMLLAGALLASRPAAAAQAVVVARGLDQPWALAFLPDGRMLVTERPGRIRPVAEDGTVGAPLRGVPPVDATGQCGLLDLAVDPAHATNRLLYWTYAEAGEGGNTVAVARGRLEADALVDVQVIFRQQPRVASRLHCGSRLAYARILCLAVEDDDGESLSGETPSAPPVAGPPSPDNRTATLLCRKASTAKTLDELDEAKQAAMKAELAGPHRQQFMAVYARREKELQEKGKPK
jgi:hypothetical protein